MKYMRYRHGLLSLFLLLSFFSAGLAFYDDFEIYNSVINPYFTSNYTVNNSLYNSVSSSNGGGWYINSSSNVYLHYYDINYGYVGSWYESSLVNINYTKISSNADFNLGFYLLSGSKQYHGGRPILSVVYFANNTDSSNPDISKLRGYVVNFGIEDVNNISIELRRCDGGLQDPSICGVQLNLQYLGVNNDSIYYSSGYIVNNSLPINLTYNPATALMSVIVNNTVVLTHTDTLYNSGGFMLIATHRTGSASVGPTILNLDNLSISGVSGVAAGAIWQTYSFPQNRINEIGLGNPYLGYPTSLALTLLQGTNFYHNFYNGKFYDGTYPLNTNFDLNLVMKHNNSYFSPATLDGYSMTLGLSSPHYNTCYVKIGGPTDYDIGHAVYASNPVVYDTFLYDINRDALSNYNNPSYFTTDPYILTMPSTVFFCVSPENLSLAIAVSNVGLGTYEVLNYVIPMGYRFYPNGTVDYNTVIDAATNDTSIYIIHYGENNTGADPNAPNQIDIIALALVSPTLVALYLAIFLAGAITYFTRSPLFGIFTLVAALLVMSAVGLLGSWFMYLLIVVAALMISLMFLKK